MQLSGQLQTTNGTPSTKGNLCGVATRSARARGQGHRQAVYLFLSATGIEPKYFRNDNPNVDWVRQLIYISATLKMSGAIALAKRLAADVNAGRLPWEQARDHFYNATM